MGSLAERIRRTKTMEIKQAIAFNLSSSEFLVDGYLADLKGSELLVRPVPGPTTSPGNSVT